MESSPSLKLTCFYLAAYSESKLKSAPQDGVEYNHLYPKVSESIRIATSQIVHPLGHSLHTCIYVYQSLHNTMNMYV